MKIFLQHDTDTLMITVVGIVELILEQKLASQVSLIKAASMNSSGLFDNLLESQLI